MLPCLDGAESLGDNVGVTEGVSHGGFVVADEVGAETPVGPAAQRLASVIRPNRRLSVTQGPATVASGTWNGAGQLTAYTDPAAAMSGAAYDGSGLRASATFTPAGGSAATRNFVWDTTPTVPQLLMDSANAYIYAGPGAPAEQVSLATGTVTYLSADALGSVRGTVNSSGTLAGTTTKLVFE